MIYLLVFLIIFIVILLAIISFVSYKYLKLNRELQLRDKFLRNTLNSINSVRWGNLYKRAQEGYDKETIALAEGLNALFESVSDREKMIREYIEKEKETNIMKADFMATLTHDLKVPIIAQDNTFQLFLDGRFGEISDVQKEVIEKLKSSNMDLKHLVETLLETYRIENAGIKIKKTKDVEIGNFVKSVVDEMDSIVNVADKKIVFENEIGEKKGNFDIFTIKRVLQNVLINAIKNSKSKGIIDVNVKECDDKKYRIDVKDYGVGIKESEIKKIFEKYYSNQTKFSGSGVGLGLYLSNKAVKLHGGKIEVKSKEGEGSMFSIILNYE